MGIKKAFRSSMFRRRRLWDGRSLEVSGQHRNLLRDVSHRAMTVSWTGFILVTAILFVAINALFALLYPLGHEPLANMPEDSFIYYFFFSIETLTTVGYGDMHPQTLWGHIVASIESFAGIFSIAVMTGLIFSRFARPSSRILFARSPIIGAYDGQRVFMTRLANERHNAICDARAQLWMLYYRMTREGRRYRSFLQLPLIRAENPTFFLSWLLLHRIDEESPLYGKTAQELEAMDVAFVVTINGYDESSAQMVYARNFYGYKDLHWEHYYADILENTPDGLRLNYERFHQTHNSHDNNSPI